LAMCFQKVCINDIYSPSRKQPIGYGMHAKHGLIPKHHIKFNY
jgi:hypothetical protein